MGQAPKEGDGLAVRIVAISDTHTFENEISIPDGDVLIHAGDATIEGSIAEVTQFAAWLEAQPHKHKIFVAGNHDWLFQTQSALARSMIKGVAHYLQDVLIEIDGVRFYGSPWQPRFCDWAFNVDRGEAIAEKWAQIQECDVLITHGPPWGVLDYVKAGAEHLGCEELGKAVERLAPQAHVFGHIHGGHGRHRTEETLFVNASICDEAYRPVNAPQVIQL